MSCFDSNVFYSCSSELLCEVCIVYYVVVFVLFVFVLLDVCMVFCLFFKRGNCCSFVFYTLINMGFFLLKNK